MSRISKMLNEEILDPFLSLVNKCPVLNTPTDWKETPECHVFTADLPGLSKEEVTVEVVDDDGGKVLQISGNRKNDVEEEDDEGKGKEKEGGKRVNRWHRVERCRGEFRRRFRLPENAKTDEVKATMENGVLVVKIPKQEVKKPQRKVVQIK